MNEVIQRYRRVKDPRLVISKSNPGIKVKDAGFVSKKTLNRYGKNSTKEVPSSKLILEKKPSCKDVQKKESQRSVE